MKAVCIILLIFAISKQIGSDLFTARKKEIFPEDYNKFEPPWSKGNAAAVYIRLYVLDVDKIDDGAMEYSIHLYFSEYWKDYRLNLSSFQGDDDWNPIFPPYLTNYLWVPDLIFENSKSGLLFKYSLPNTAIKVLKTGSFKKTSRYNLVVGCPMDFHFYPMDTQECFIKIATLSNPDYKLRLFWVEEHPEKKRKSIMLKNRIKPLKYTLREPETHTSTEMWSDGNYTFLYANFTFDRRLSGSVFNVYVPSTLVVFLSWISFWVGIEAVPARVTLGVTSLLTLETQVVQAHSGLPAISYMTAMDIWLFVCLLSVFSSLLEFAFAYQNFIFLKQPKVKEKKTASPRDEPLVLRSRLGQNLSIRSGWLSRINSEEQEHVSPTIVDPKSLDKVCRKVFPLLFLVFAFIYWIYYLSIKWHWIS